ncbi:MAG: sigma-54-dependent Fis family transcriptional regulator [Calditrichia bacterium]|nr:sigma-54-dependent Fis family transcriptional regulator [Calditrichia bacterium]
MNLFESEMFGHKKGSFTGAISDQTGKLEIADKGTLLLEEISNLSSQLQAKLLSVLENQTISPVGYSRETPVNFRLISTTSQNINELMKTKIIREDFLYRINVFQLKIPPLSERKEDILPYFRSLASGTIDIDLNNFDIQRVLTYHNWRGNLKEMANLISRLSLYEEKISAELLQMVLLEKQLPGIQVLPDFYFSMQDIQKIYARYVYKSLNSKKKASEQLKISVKT